MRNQLNIALTFLCLLCSFTQGIPLDPTSPLGKAVLEKREPVEDCQFFAGLPAKHYFRDFCSIIPHVKYTTLQAQCTGDPKWVTLKCRDHLEKPEFADKTFTFKCGYKEVCIQDVGMNCFGDLPMPLASCSKRFYVDRIGTSDDCVGEQDIEIPDGSGTLWIRSFGGSATIRDITNGVEGVPGYFAGPVSGPSYLSVRVNSKCGVQTYYSIYKGI